MTDKDYSIAYLKGLEIIIEEAAYSFKERKEYAMSREMYCELSEIRDRLNSLVLKCEQRPEDD